MDSRKIDAHPNPREKANIFSILTWTHWFAELEWAKRQKNGCPSFFRALFRTLAKEFFILGFLQILNEFIVRLAAPILLGALLQYFKPVPKTSYEMALYYAGGIIFMHFINVIAQNQSMFRAFHLGGRISIAACSVVYRKALRLSKTVLGETAPGKIVNLVASDVNRFDYITIFAHHLWSAPLSAIVIMIFLYLEVGWPAMIGLFVIVLIMSFQAYLGRLSAKYRLQAAQKTDERVRLMDGIISGVRVIKMYAWEKPFCNLIELTRRLELKMIKRCSYIRGFYMTFSMITPRAALFSTLITMMLRNQELSADKVYMYMLYFDMISLTMSTYFVRALAELAECKVAVKRLQNFLMYEEFEPGSKSESTSTRTEENNDCDGKNSPGNLKQEIVLRAVGLLGSFDHERMSDANAHKSSRNENWAVKMTHITSKWDLSSSDITLKDINLEVAKNKLYIVIGMVGSGKSSLVFSILGELKAIEGGVKVKGSISYADQDAWIFGATVRRNIIFGQEFDGRRYQEVVRVCALESDFYQFPDGDQTLIGERGCSLSGGQKARINLARAIYREADIYLLDDPLSAVDAHVSKHLFVECIQKILADKTRILVTHQLQYIKAADTIILVDQGKVYEFIDYNELMSVHPEYNSMIKEEENGLNEPWITNIGRHRLSSSSTKIRVSENALKFTGEDSGDDTAMKKDQFFEKTSRGAVKGNLLLNYIKSGTNSMFGFTVLFLFIATQFCASLYEYFIPILINAEESRYHYIKVHELVNTSMSSDNVNTGFIRFKKQDILPRNAYIYIYAGILFSILVVGIARLLAFYTMCIRCSQSLHDFAFGGMIRSTMRFFETNPSGRILNRFSKDLGAIDEYLPRAIFDFGQLHLNILGSLIVTCTVNFLFLVPISLIVALSYIAQKIYLKTSMDLKRLEGMTRSPVFTHLNTTLNGITTVRAYQSEEILKKEFDKWQDMHTSSWYMYIATSIAFVFSLDFLCFILMALVTFSFLLLKETFSGGVVGLVITRFITISILLQSGLRQNAEIRNQLMSVERVLEYAQLPSEPNLRNKGNFENRKLKKDEQEKAQLIEPPKNWPSEGRIDFRNVFMRYSHEDPAVLKGLTFNIQPCEKVGILGRTGAGKSSLISALFRLSKVDGVIEIDGIDTSTLALEDLWKRVSTIPQDPVLFSETLRRNLDPLSEFSDELLWQVLEEVELKDSVNLTGNGLNHPVQDRGSNYSTGQRQLICLARAILRKNQILVLDEATANVDPHTDALIQRTIRTKFATCTVLTVAHRLNTIMDSDRVLVMEGGKSVEFDHPYVLLENNRGSFSLLLKETGPAMYEQLCEVAHESYIAKYGGTNL